MTLMSRGAGTNQPQARSARRDRERGDTFALFLVRRLRSRPICPMIFALVTTAALFIDATPVRSAGQTRSLSQERLARKTFGLSARMTEEDELWDEELEAMEHLQYLVRRKEQIEALRSVHEQVEARLDAQAALGSLGGAPRAAASSDPPPADDHSSALWAEEVESQEHLRELAYWDASICKVKELLRPPDALSATEADDYDMRGAGGTGRID